MNPPPPSHSVVGGQEALRLSVATIFVRLEKHPLLAQQTAQPLRRTAETAPVMGGRPALLVHQTVAHVPVLSVEILFVMDQRPARVAAWIVARA